VLNPTDLTREPVRETCRGEPRVPRGEDQDPGPAPAAHKVVLKPSSGWRALDLREIWRYRELLWFLAVRDIKVRYKQTALGAAWAVIQPLFTMIVFTVFFGNLAQMPSDGLPYPVFAFCALLPWTLFAYALTQSSNSLVAEQRLISKVYFPRLILPFASVISGLADFAIAFGFFLILMLCYGIVPTWAVLTVPLLVVFAVAAALAVGLWLSAWNVQYRDVRYTIPFLTQIWMFLTPIAYPSSLVPEPWRTFYGLNPMAGVVEGFRWALLGKAEPPGAIMLVSLVTVVVMLVGGMFYFKKVEKTFADVI
jgi:lipopolysaccharide transport system permease protein